MSVRQGYMRMPERSPLSKFAFLGTSFSNTLAYLARLAEPENWYYNAPNSTSEEQRKFGVLFQYLHHTFARAEDEDKVLIRPDRAVLNTGLFTPYGEEIYCLFGVNSKRGIEGFQDWYLQSFYSASDHSLASVRHELPEYVNFFDGNEESLYFDTSLDVVVNMEHIVRDNISRLPPHIQAFGTSQIGPLLQHSIDFMKKKIKRNNRLVIPQYYNKSIMYLAPLQIGMDVVPLAIERTGQSYRVNTIFTLDMAYCNARLLMKPESNWLTNDTSKVKEAVSQRDFPIQ